MFDWNDEELTNIIWGEAEQNSDHLVPYPGRNEDDGHKRIQNQDAARVKPTCGIKSENNSSLNKDRGIPAPGLDAWPDLSLSQVAKNDREPFDGGVTDNVAEVTKFNSAEAEEAQTDPDPSLFGKHHGKEHGDFADYGWENIGSFDDLDQIFSNDEPIFPQVSLENAGEIWSSSKDATNSPAKSFSISADSPGFISGALTSSSEILQLKTEYKQQDGQAFDLDFDKMNDPSSLCFQHRNAFLELSGSSVDKSGAIVRNQKSLAMVEKTQPTNSHLVNDSSFTLDKCAAKIYRQKVHQKSQKKSKEKAQGKLMQSISDSWSSPVDSAGQYRHNSSPYPAGVGQSREIRQPESFHYQQISDPYSFPSAFSNYADSFPAILSPSNFQSGEINCQTTFPGYEVSSAYVDHTGTRLDSPRKPPTMTPQEKIEKLRRRQQMQAMLAIQKQLQQFSNQDSEHSATQKLPLENQNQHSEHNQEIGDLRTLASVDVTSSTERDSSTLISAAVDGRSVEDVVLHQLQDVIAKLDDRTRIFIRNSLYRLAKGAVQRKLTSNMNTSNATAQNEHGVLVKEETGARNREVRQTGVEMDTNPADRAVAYLLFHRPPEFSAKHHGTLESSTSPKLCYKPKLQDAENSQIEAPAMSSKTDLESSQQGLETSDQMTEPHAIDQFGNSPCIEPSETLYRPVEGTVACESSNKHLS